MPNTIARWIFLPLPIAGELQGALADGGAEGLVGGDGVEPFGLRLVVGSQEVKQTQGLALRSQLFNVRQREAVADVDRERGGRGPHHR